MKSLPRHSGLGVEINVSVPDNLPGRLMSLFRIQSLLQEMTPQVVEFGGRLLVRLLKGFAQLRLPLQFHDHFGQEPPPEFLGQAGEWAQRWWNRRFHDWVASVKKGRVEGCWFVQ